MHIIWESHINQNCFELSVHVWLFQANDFLVWTGTWVPRSYVRLSSSLSEGDNWFQDRKGDWSVPWNLLFLNLNTCCILAAFPFLTVLKKFCWVRNSARQMNLCMHACTRGDNIPGHSRELSKLPWAVCPCLPSIGERLSSMEARDGHGVM